jgi:thioredoxin reductase (NADPH)
LAQVENLRDRRLPICIFSDGARLESPTARSVADKLGWVTQPVHEEYDVSIYGAGPGGLSAAVYAPSEGLKCVLIERTAIGRQAGTSSKIENYLGFPVSISGAKLGRKRQLVQERFPVRWNSSSGPGNGLRFRVRVRWE